MIPSEDRMNICLDEKYLRLQGSSTENFFFTVLFPWLCLIGIIGNCLNLTVLLSPDVKHRSTSINQRSNVLLVALAFCDILFLILMIPHSLANFDYFGLDLTFRMLYLPTKVHLISLANWISAVAIWLVIAICAERLIGIRSFQYSKTSWSRCTTAHIIICIVAGSALLTSYNHFSYHCIVKLLCNQTQIISVCFDVIQETWKGNHTNMTPTAIRLYVRWSQVANVIIIIVLPIVIMLALNIALLFVVRKQSFLMYSRLHSASTNSENGSTPPSTCAKCKRRISITSAVTYNAISDSGQRKKSSIVIAPNSPPSIPACILSSAEGEVCQNFMVCTQHVPSMPPQSTTTQAAPAPVSRKSSTMASESGNPPLQSSLFRRSIDQTVQFQAEHRVTVTVCAIVTCFTITQGPSAIVLSISFLSGHNPPFVNSNELWYHVNTVTGFLVIIGKTLNFILFCLSSAAFRRRLVKILRKKFLFLTRRSSFLINSSAGNTNQGIMIPCTNGTIPNTFQTVSSTNRRKTIGEHKLSLAT